MYNEINQDGVYEQQEKNFNIISLQPVNHGHTHRKYPRLTLEDGLLEKGGYWGSHLH